MKLSTISEVSKDLGISTRMLRYYEQIGLIKSLRKEEYAYRVYDETALRRLRQIIILRKLRIPIKQICMILNNPDTSVAVDVFSQNIEELNVEIGSLSTIRSILQRFVEMLREQTDIRIKPKLTDDETLLTLIGSLSFPINTRKEEMSMEDLNKANANLSKLKDIRIIYLPPMTVASSHYVGEDSEMHSSEALDRFVKESGLLKIKPDTRHFGFNNPIQMTALGTPSAGYEMWVSIPDEMEVPAPLKKIRFYGGLYAAHAITFPNFDEWGLLHDWLMSNGKYESDWGSIRCDPHIEGMDWAMEELLNYWNNAQNPDFIESMMQLDLLFPIKEKTN